MRLTGTFPIIKKSGSDETDKVLFRFRFMLQMLMRHETRFFMAAWDGHQILINFLLIIGH